MPDGVTADRPRIPALYCTLRMGRQTIAFCPNPLAHLSVTRGGGLPRSLNAVQIIVIDLGTDAQPLFYKRLFQRYHQCGIAAGRLHPNILLGCGHESVKAARARQSPTRAWLYQWHASAWNGALVHSLRAVPFPTHHSLSCAVFVPPRM
jgi:hypothetical protein